MATDKGIPMLDDEAIETRIDNEARHDFDRCALFGLPAVATNEDFAFAVGSEAHPLAIAKAGIVERKQGCQRLTGIVDLLACEGLAIRAGKKDQAPGFPAIDRAPVCFSVKRAPLGIVGGARGVLNWRRCEPDRCRGEGNQRHAGKRAAASSRSEMHCDWLRHGRGVG